MRSPFFFFAVLAVLMLGMLVPRAGAVTGQPLSIVLHGDAARTRLLPAYEPAAPIAVRVGGDARGVDAITLTASSPGHAAIVTPLIKRPDAFVGTISLRSAGAWTVMLTTRSAGVDAAYPAVSVSVETPRADPIVLALFAFSAVSTLCGIVIVGRVVRRRSAASSRN